jgi:uncharacterized membrane-anchored protein
MMKIHFSLAARAVAAGAVCLAILAGMVVGHAWPLWTGKTILLPVQAHDDRSVFRGEYVHITTPGNRVVVSADPAVARPSDAVVLPPGRRWPANVPADYHERRRLLQALVVYVQFEPIAGSVGPEYRPVSISTEPEPGKMNVRGRIRVAMDSLFIDFGLDAFYMQQGTARHVEEALRSGRRVHMQVAVAASGRARIRNLLLDGQEVIQ